MMNPEDKEILSEAISEGIKNGFWKPISQILSGIILGVLILVLIFVGSVTYNNYKEEQCVASDDCPRIVMVKSQSPESQYKPKLDCRLFVGNATIQYEVYGYGAEDYIDANAKLEQLRPFITNINKTMIVLGDKLEGNTSDWKIIGIQCK